MAMTREQAATAVAEATAERDSIQTNLLDLDGSFGKRMLAGAALSGESRRRWSAVRRSAVRDRSRNCRCRKSLKRVW